MDRLSRPIALTFPKVVECGRGAVEKIGAWSEREGHRRALIVADTFNAGRVDRLGLTCEVVVFDGVRGEPELTDLDAALTIARSAPPDVVIGFGGGSAMDLAKLVAVLHDGDQPLDQVVGPDKVKGRRSALAQVSTTSGTGSECGTRALISDPDHHRKLAVESRHMLADLAVIDPELTLSVPADVTAATGVDALAHCVESFTNVKAHPIVDLYAAEGIRLVGRHLAAAVADGSNVEARMGMALASMYGGLCLGPVNTAAGHAVAYPLGTRYGLPHGLANALVFPYVLAFNAPACPEKTGRILAWLGLADADAPSAEETYRFARSFCERLGLAPAGALPDLNESDLQTLADEAFAIKRLLDNNPRPVGRDDILGIYRHLVGHPE